MSDVQVVVCQYRAMTNDSPKFLREDDQALRHVSFEPFTVLSLALPVSGNSTVKRFLQNYYEDTVITDKCPQCS